MVIIFPMSIVSNYKNMNVFMDEGDILQIFVSRSHVTTEIVSQLNEKKIHRSSVNLDITQFIEKVITFFPM